MPAVLVTKPVMHELAVSSLAVAKTTASSPGFPLTWLQKCPGLSRTPEALFQNPVVCQRCQT